MSASDIPAGASAPSESPSRARSPFGAHMYPSRLHSSASSIHSQFSNNSGRHHVMVRYLHKKFTESRWLEPDGDNDQHLGVVLRSVNGLYVCEPQSLSQMVTAAVETLGVPVAFTMSSEIVAGLLEQVTPFQKELVLSQSNIVLPIIDSIESLANGTAGVSRDSYMCLCRREAFVLVWVDAVSSLHPHANDVESKLLSAVWGSAEQVKSPASPAGSIPNHSSPLTHATMRELNPFYPSNPNSSNNSSGNRELYSPAAYFNQTLNGGMLTPNTPMNTIYSEKLGIIQTAIEREDLGDKAFDLERDGAEPPKRPFLLTHAVVIGLAIILVITVEMACAARLIQETRLDGKYLRWALLATVPIFTVFSLFFMIVISGSLFQLFGPLSGVRSNSTYYSANAPKPGRYPDLELPHITIQMPVYKEGLKGVIIPTVTTLLAAVRKYEAQGGTASIYVNDDGMQLVKPELAEARKAFYELNNIGWCSRPAHNDGSAKNAKKGGFFGLFKFGGGKAPVVDESVEEEKASSKPIFLRKGKFKKASNMNYCLDFSIRVEDEMMRLFEQACIERGCAQEDLTMEEENELYEQARNTILEHDGGKTLSDGDVRIGEIILIIDSDTRVPEDCLLYGALEMHESPEVALLQHSSGILQVAHNVFENGITYFTNLIYTSIQFAVGNGDCAPFVGHNTFIRWKAIQSVAFQEDETTKFWSDNHVSEDFDLSLRLQMKGFVVRMATYHDGGFQEGVSLTVYDELARWEKYAYGCNELVFNPLIKWPRRGPFTRLFMRFMWSNIKITSKITILAYIGTYYAIASALPLTLFNYLIVGLFASEIDQFYVTSWKIFVGMAVVYNIFSPLAYAMLRHRLGQKTFFWSIIETIKWTPMFLLFFGGISYHLSKAIFCHFFSLNMEWTTTAKEVQQGGFRVGLDRVIRDFKGMYAFIIPVTGGMIYLALYAPRGWQITDFTVIVPLANQIGCHALLPFALGLF